MRYALINPAGLVENVILLEDAESWPLPSGMTLQQTDKAGPGWTWDGAQFVSPPGPAPTAVILPDYAADARWRKETGGITVGGAAISTDRESQSMINGALSLVKEKPEAVVMFKAGGVFVKLDAASVTAIALAVGAHVQACFAKEAEVVAAIAAGTITTTAEIDEAFSGV